MTLAARPIDSQTLRVGVECAPTISVSRRNATWAPSKRVRSSVATLEYPLPGPLERELNLPQACRATFQSLDRHPSSISRSDAALLLRLHEPVL